jgi:phosphatidylglycerophosphatase GEP4
MTFGKSNVLIVSNSVGSSIDPLGIRAADVSMNLGGTPVLWHRHKKPSRHCSSEIISYFQKQSVLGSIAVIGDRPTTDLALAHRISDQLEKLYRKQEHRAPAVSSADAEEHTRSADRRSSRGIAIFTTGLWASEGRINQLMRNAEVGVVKALVRRGIEPGKGWKRSRESGSAETSIKLDAKSQGLVGSQSSRWQMIAAPSPAAETLINPAAVSEGEFAFSRERQPAFSQDPSLSSLLTRSMSSRAPRLARTLTRIGRSRPVVWAVDNARLGLRVIWVGLAQGLMQAGIWQPKRIDDLPDDLRDPVSPRISRQSSRGGLLNAPLLFSTRSALSRLREADAGYSRDPSGPRGLHSSARSSATGGPTQTPSSPRRIPLRNWLAAIAALILAPGGWMLGVYLHELGEEKSAAKSGDGLWTLGGQPNLADRMESAGESNAQKARTEREIEDMRQK